MPVFYDQMNNAIDLPAAPRRIISIVPSQTELLFYLGLGERVVGVTKFCIHPADKVKQVAKIGGTKQLNIEAIHQLQPDLIVANKEENEQSQVEKLMKHYPVWISDITDLDGALDMITKVGEVTGKLTEALSLSNKISLQFHTLKTGGVKTRVAYLIWRKPYMVAGSGTFINSMLQLCGFENAVNATRYPELTIEGIKEVNPQVILLSSEPYPFAKKHIDEFKKLLPDAKVMLVDGEMFSWYGSRLLHAPAYFKGLIDKLTPM
ncbi:helical backbone metal receptor [Mucilaginibacter sp. AK015]|uniref:helical backbone metal receptor n=1 Tax=Mucilaginibacter sp. AK015 TaxID=2723072 RepID=UPI00160FB8A8|nr:helical backbone metal receptor [Mucilaginibacter sp. AK015]MBB5394562.1 ABC-type Fe3+-hydroxamate transport system substrate-binding protein [Mucilaginibacter sp. AK015]